MTEANDVSRGTTETMLAQETRREGELAQSSGAARAKAEIEAAYTVAIKYPRSFMDARRRVLESCKRPRFAEVAKYRKPVGTGAVTGPSIRFAEEAAKSMGNIQTSIDTVYEDVECRKIRVAAVDLETNLRHAVEINVSKTVERKSLKEGQEMLGQRKNTQGQTVYILRATDDDMLNKTLSAASKALRTVLLRLIPQDLIEEAMDTVTETLQSGTAKDPAAARKRMADAFAEIGVRPVDLEKYLGHPLDATTPAEIEELRSTYNSIRDKETTWAEVMAAKNGDAPAEKADSRAEALSQKLKAAAGKSTSQKTNAELDAEIEAKEREAMSGK